VSFIIVGAIGFIVGCIVGSDAADRSWGRFLDQLDGRRK
jgi:hypothetical protein